MKHGSLLTTALLAEPTLRHWLRIGGGALVLVLAAQTAGAVVVTVNVKTPSGEAVPGATITLRPEDPTQPPVTATTDDQGRATLDVLQGNYRLTIRRSDSFSTQLPLTVGNQPQSVDVTARPMTPTIGSTPINIGAQFRSTSFDDVVPTTLDSTFRDIIEGELIGEETVAESNEASNPDQQNQVFAQAALGPGALGNGSPLMLRDIHWQRPMESSASGLLRSVQTQGGQGGGGWRVYPAVTGGVGSSSVEFEFISDTSDQRTTYKGDGFAWNVGGFVVLFPCKNCNWFTGLGYNYAKVNEFDVPRDPPLIGGEDFVIAQDDVTYESSTQRIEGTIGYAFRYVAPFGGVRGTFHTVTLRGEGRVDEISFPASLEFSFINEFEANDVFALAGADVRIPRTVVFVRFLGATNGDNHSLSASVAYGFGR